MEQQEGRHHPIWSLQGISSSIFRHIHIKGSRGCCSSAFRVTEGYFCQASIAHLHVADNSCAGVELRDFSGKFDNEVLELQHVKVEHNCYHSKSQASHK